MFDDKKKYYNFNHRMLRCCHLRILWNRDKDMFETLMVEHRGSNNLDFFLIYIVMPLSLLMAIQPVCPK
jgi:hypothetical protein